MSGDNRQECTLGIAIDIHGLAQTGPSRLGAGGVHGAHVRLSLGAGRVRVRDGGARVDDQGNMSLHGPIPTYHAANA